MRGATKKPYALKAVSVVSFYRIGRKQNGPSRDDLVEGVVSARMFPAMPKAQIIKATVFEGSCPVRRSSGA